MNADWHRVGVLRELDGVETINGQVRDDANVQAEALARNLRVPGIGGSDAHAVDMVGAAATRFAQPVRSDAELVAALKTGDYEALRLRE